MAANAEDNNQSEDKELPSPREVLGKGKRRGKKKQIAVRIWPDQYKQILKEAEAAGCADLSEFLRHRLGISKD